MTRFRLALTAFLTGVFLPISPVGSTVLFSETGTPDTAWSDDGDLNDWMIGFTEQDVINAGWSGTGAEAAWLLDPWHSPENKVLAVRLLKLSPSKDDAQDGLLSSPWRDTVGRVDVSWTLFCNVALLYAIEPGFTETIRVDMKAQDTIVDSVSVGVSGNGFSNWIFMAGSVHEPAAETGVHNWRIQVSLGHLTHANSVTVMVDDILVCESQYLEFFIGRSPNPAVTVAVESGAELNPLPLPTLSKNASGDMILSWRSVEGYTYDVKRSAARSFGGAVWRNIAEGLAHDPSGTISLSDDGAGRDLDGAYYRVVVHSP